MKIAIIGGSGKMGRWLADFLLKEGKEVIITGRNQEKLRAAGRQLGIAVATNEEAVKRSDVVVLSVPIDSFAQIVEAIAPYTRPDQIIVDVTSVKTMPVAAMHQHIKNGVVLGAHPLFGPGAKGVANLNFVLTPTSEKESALAQKVREFLEARSARVTVMSPQEHDEMMTVILGLAHFIALVAADTLSGINKLKDTEAISGITYRVLLTLIESVVSEDPELYVTLQMALPNLVHLEEQFQQKAKLWTDLVKNKDKTQFVARMNALKSAFEKNATDFGKAYENMYKLAGGDR